MKVSANSAPVNLYRVEAHPQLEDRVIVTVIDGRSVSVGEGPAGDTLVTYDQYQAAVPWRDGLEADIEAHYGAWLAALQSADPEYAARKAVASEMCAMAERLLDAELALAQAGAGGP